MAEKSDDIFDMTEQNKKEHKWSIIVFRKFFFFQEDD